MRPIKIARKVCSECAGSSKGIITCGGERLLLTGEVCSLYEYRFGRKPKNPKLRILEALRKHCFFCMVGSPKEIRLCPSMKCYIFAHRFGKNPNRRKTGRLKKTTTLSLPKKSVDLLIQNSRAIRDVSMVTEKWILVYGSTVKAPWALPTALQFGKICKWFKKEWVWNWYSIKKIY